ncbi:DUF2269 domain-containing protein [Marinicrinis lubricantis]
MWLFLHLLGALLFVGNIVTAAFWKIRADSLGDVKVIHYAVKNVMLADYVFTLPGLVLLVVSGTVMAEQAGYLEASFNWLSLSLLLFGLTGVLWLGMLIPLQRKMIRLSAQAANSGLPPAEYRKASLHWAIFGTAATLLPVVILYLMIAMFPANVYAARKKLTLAENQLPRWGFEQCCRSSLSRLCCSPDGTPYKLICKCTEAGDTPQLVPTDRLEN